MNKFVITRWNGRMVTALFDGKEALEIGLEEETSILGNIYIGTVKNIVASLNAAFVEFGQDQVGYYSMEENKAPLFADGSKGKLKCGSEIVVQVAKEAVKTKDPVLTANLNFTGRYAVLTAGKKTVGFSSKISDKAWKESLRPRIAELTGGQAGIIVRTNAYGFEEALLKEVGVLYETWRKVMETARYRSSRSLLYEAEPQYQKSLQSCRKGTVGEIVTDDHEVYENVRRYLSLYDPDILEFLRLYQDPKLSLCALYSLETVMDRACQKRVWLKSGGYLVIEYTEAMSVIDVNTGKYSGKKNLEDTIRMINLEAAQEICHQLRLRNLSGIIMVDFIDMKAEEDRQLLLETLRTLALKDPVKTTVVDMTQLNLVEMTRKKEKRPLWEQMANFRKTAK